MAYRKEFEPLVAVDQNILLLPERKPFKVVYIEPLAMITKDFGTLAAGGTLTDQKIVELTMPTNELGQFRFAPLDDFTIRVKQPRAVGRFLTKEVQITISKAIWQLNPELHLTEIYVFQDGVPFFDITNPTGYELPMTRVLFIGFRFQLEPLAVIPPKYTAIPVMGKPVGSPGR